METEKKISIPRASARSIAKAKARSKSRSRSSSRSSASPRSRSNKKEPTPLEVTSARPKRVTKKTAVKDIDPNDALLEAATAIPAKKTATKKAATTAKKPPASDKPLKTDTIDSPILAEFDLEKKPWLTIEFIDHIYNRLKSEHISAVRDPKVLILIGPPASGKSTVKKQLHFSNCINIDLDEIKIIATEAFQNKAFPIINDFATIIQIMVKKAINDSYNIILDSTGKMVSPIKYVVKKTHEASYKIIFAFVWSSLETVRERAEFRNASQLARQAMPGRVIISVYEEFIKKGIMSYYLIDRPHILQLANEVYLFNNDVNTTSLKDTPLDAKIQSNAQIVFKRADDVVEVANRFEGYYDVNVLSEAPYFEKHRAIAAATAADSEAADGRGRGKGSRSYKKNKRSNKKTKKNKSYKKE
jgi:predicted kinase